MNNFFIVTIFFLPCDSLYLKKGEKRQWGGDRIQGGGKGVRVGKPCCIFCGKPDSRNNRILGIKGSPGSEAGTKNRPDSANPLSL
ncbi:MAG: hypothetical protein B6245_13205 [Desulfobacteraceae bacterium 4572_88]|nr:MAG: hypothetical protein B6245_13205 [Desulfobacteraceae bacterium 4572_88]